VKPLLHTIILAASMLLPACASTLDAGTTGESGTVTMAKGARVLFLEPVVRQANVVELDLKPWPEHEEHSGATPLRNDLVRKLQAKGLDVSAAGAKSGSASEADLRDLHARGHALAARQRQHDGADAVLASLCANAKVDYVGVLRVDQWLGKGGDAFSGANLAKMRFVLLATADGATAFAAEAVMRVRLTETSADAVGKLLTKNIEVR
jgi:hypothetical protein